MHKGFSAEPSEPRSWGRASVILCCGCCLGLLVALSIFVLLVVSIFLWCICREFTWPIHTASKARCLREYHVQPKALGQHGFELRGSACVWIVFSSKYHNTTWSAVGWIGGGKTSGTEGRLSVIHRFFTAWSVSPLTYPVVQGSTVLQEDLALEVATRWNNQASDNGTQRMRCGYGVHLSIVFSVYFWRKKRGDVFKEKVCQLFVMGHLEKTAAVRLPFGKEWAGTYWAGEKVCRSLDELGGMYYTCRELVVMGSSLWRGGRSVFPSSPNGGLREGRGGSSWGLICDTAVGLRTVLQVRLAELEGLMPSRVYGVLLVRGKRDIKATLKTSLWVFIK